MVKHNQQEVLKNTRAVDARVFSFQFMLLCTSSFLFFSSFNMIIPSLPDYLTSLGGEDYKGLIISLFTLTAGLSRPFSGKLADTIGRIPVMIFGASVCFGIGFLYPILSSVAGFLFLRFVHGLSTGFKPTGTSAYVADIIPFNKRGEAMGVIGMANSLGMAAGPALGGYLMTLYPINYLFYTSSAMAIGSVIILIGMKETLKDREPFRLSLLKIRRREVIEPQVLTPAFVLLLSVFSFGIVLTISPDMSAYVGIENKGLFYTYFTLASLLVRFLAGKASDKYGRVRVLRYSMFLLVIAMLVIGLAQSPFVFLSGAVLFGLATGMNSPTLYAWAIDLSHETRRGRAMATVYIFLEAGIGLGAIASGWIYGNNSAHFGWTFWSGGILALIAWYYLLFRVKSRDYR